MKAEDDYQKREKELLAQRLKEVFRVTGLTAPKMAKGLGLTKSTVYTWTKALIWPSMAHIRKIAVLYQIAPNWLTMGMGPMMLNHEDPEYLKLTPEGLESYLNSCDHLIRENWYPRWLDVKTILIRNFGD